jgi:hypothetical protein
MRAFARPAVVALLAGCSHGVPLGAPLATTAVTGTGWERVVDPFSVTDSTGRPLDLPFLGGLNIPRPQLVDLDGDGAEDLVLQEYGGRMILLTRDGSRPDGLPRFRYRTDFFERIGVGEWSRFADFDGDGDLDLFAEWENSYIRAFRNTGSRQAGRFVALPDTLRDDAGKVIFADRQNIAQFVDIDCNQKIDLLIGRVSGTILHYEIVDPKAGIPTFHLVNERFQDLLIITGQGSRHGANTMAFVDHDRDGDLDLFWGDFFEAGLLLFENTGSCREPRLRQEGVRFPVDAPVVTSGYNAPAFADLDGDQKLDLVLGVLGGAYDPIRTSIANLHYFSSAARGQWAHQTDQLLTMIDVGSEAIPSIVDLDGDGDQDLVVANKIGPIERATSRLYWFENIGNPGAPSFRGRGALAFNGRYHLAPAWVDLDGDGVLDVVMGSYGPKIGWFRGAGGLQWAEVDSALVTITRGSNTVPALGDLDGDGDLDLFVGESSGSLNYYRNDGDRTAPRFVLVSDEYEQIDVGRRSAPTLSDIDDDRDLDLLIGSDDHGVVLYRNRGSLAAPAFALDSTLRIDLPVLASPAMGDLEGDGRRDLLIGTSAGGVLFFRGRP